MYFRKKMPYLPRLLQLCNIHINDFDSPPASNTSMQDGNASIVLYVHTCSKL